MLHIDVNFACPLWNKEIKKTVEQTLKAAFKFMRKDADSEVSVVLTSDNEIQKLNYKYRGMNKPTNVLSFESGDETMLGDIVIAYQTLLHESLNEKITFEAHLRHLLVHGLLHLLSYDHLNDADAEIMEKLEVEILAKMGVADPYQE